MPDCKLDQVDQAAEARARHVWLNYLCPNLPVSGLEALVQAARNNDPSLIQGDTVIPYAVLPDYCRPRGACAIGFALWKSGIVDAYEVNRQFNIVTSRLDDKMKNERPAPNEVRYFAEDFYSRWFDSFSRDHTLTRLATWTEQYLAGLAAQFSDINMTPTPVTVPTDADLALVS